MAAQLSLCIRRTSLCLNDETERLGLLPLSGWLKSILQRLFFEY